jgi:arylsulfatase
VSDEIVHAMDLFPTLAGIAGGKVPSDRVIDGIDMSGFFLGKTQQSGREGFIVYMGNDVFGVKWRDWKLHFKEQRSPGARQRAVPAHLGHEGCLATT